MNRSLPRGEFIALIAMLFASIAFSIDAMLPALPELAQAFSPDAPNRAQLVVTSFVLGMGAGTLFTGPLSDSFGRKPVLIGGAVLYIVGAFMAAHAHDLTFLLIARFVQGLGAASPRVVAVAVVRDLYAGRGMARIMSFAMMIFTLVPAIAPIVGAQLIAWFNWQAIFYAFIAFSATATLWFAIRQPETLEPEHRRPFNSTALWGAVKEMWAHRTVRLSIIVQGFAFGALFATISSIQPIYDDYLNMADSFPKWFAITALLAMSSSFLNAQLVEKLGMQRIATAMLTFQIFASLFTVVAILVIGSMTILFWVFFFWQLTMFFQAGMTMGNLNSIAMEPMGHIAGMAASITGAIATVMAVAIAAPVGLMFDGTPLPLVVSVLVMSILSVWLMKLMARLRQE